MQSIFKRLRQQDWKRLELTGLTGGCSPFFLSRLCDDLARPVCCIVPTEEQLSLLARDVALFTDVPVLLYPSFEIPPYADLSPDPATTATRLATLYSLRENEGPMLILASAEAILRRVLPARVLSDACELVISGEEIEREALIDHLGRTGYEQCDMVRRPGDMAIRGGIIDIFAPSISGEALPLRLDFFGDTVESIRSFDPVSQRSRNELDEAVLLPASDVLFPPALDRTWPDRLQELSDAQDWDEGTRDTLLARLLDRGVFPGCEFFLPLLYCTAGGVQTFFDYLPGETLLVTLDQDTCQERIGLVRERIDANYREALAKSKPALSPQSLFLDADEIRTRTEDHDQLVLRSLPDPDSTTEIFHLACGDHNLLAQEIELQRQKRGLLAPLADRLLEWTKAGHSCVIACTSRRQQEHVAEILAGYSLETALLSAPLKQIPPGGETIYLVNHPLSKGFDHAEAKLHILSAAELFGEKRLAARRTKQAATRGEPVHLDTLQPGDIVVHRDHGLGSFQGLVNMELAGQHSDFLLIEYRGGDKLYVPIDRLHWVSRYQGLADRQPRLDRLGSSHWQTTKQKVTEAVWKVARELLDIYARRELETGHQFSPPGELYRQLENSFPFEETEGQARAIADVLADMTSSRPMDRLVCGDVGYGKTEVAVRAACKAIEDGFQVAVLVPTTVLAEQHAATFRDRFAGLPVTVACLNRFRSPAQQREIGKGLAEGTVDLVVGTHRLLSKDISIKNLGLLVVDEEHRFGVTHKEKIKRLKNKVDVLTLTATPIPRTLQMSLLGIRDLSVISTPPRARQPVKTFLARHEELVIREAVINELARGGQVFYVHNRVRTISRVAEELARLVPQARIGIGHGQMAPASIEEVMVRFINHEIDVLVCTTIIESGLDIGNANTIIINRADQLGLADIYQLRGRVGRTARQSYAYLLVPSTENLSGDAKKRLRALMEASELGSGFKLAMNDLQIRGGGNLLGVSQSGHIAAVGYDLYLDLLQSTVEDLKRLQESGVTEPPLEPEVNLKLSAYLGEDYIRDTGQRYHLYRRLSLAGNEGADALADLLDEVEDRYGRLPEEAAVLWRLIGLKIPLRRLGIAKLEQAPAHLVFSFADQTPVAPETLIGLVERDRKKARRQRRRESMRLTPDGRLLVPFAEGENIFQAIETVLEQLSGT